MAVEFLILTGCAGSGKSRAVDALEDIGFYCVDNMPPNLLPTFAQLFMQSQEKPERVALVVDARSGKWFSRLQDNLKLLDEQGVCYKILFLDCDDKKLALRFKETRRQHPLAAENDNSLAKAIAAEKLLLQPVRLHADYLIDTTLLSPAQLRERVVALFAESVTAGMVVQCCSFGFKYGTPAEADLIFDVRCLPNPFYIEALRPKTGLDADVREYVLENENAQGFLKRLFDLADYMLPLYQKEGKSQLTIAIGCTGGKHRSVALTQELAAHLTDQQYHVSVNHRDISKP